MLTFAISQVALALFLIMFVLIHVWFITVEIDQQLFYKNFYSQARYSLGGIILIVLNCAIILFYLQLFSDILYQNTLEFSQ